MATAEEYLAAAARAEKAGALEDAQHLRDLATKSSPKPATRTRADYVAAADKARTAGATADADHIMQLADKQFPVQEPVQSADPRALALAAFEKANPGSKGKYTPETFPYMKEYGQATPDIAPPMQPPEGFKTSAPAPDNFGDTTANMIAGPWDATKAFAGGLAGGPSPSRDFLAQDPLTKNLPSAALTGLGGIGDMGMAALSGIGTAFSGLAGLGAEMVPGLSQKTEEDLAGGILDMSQFAAPEMFGVSSASLGLGRAGKVTAAVHDSVAQTAADISAADKLKIPVFRTDVKAPTTFVGKSVQKIGETIPMAGTGGMRSKQAAARVEAAQGLAREFGGDAIAPAIDDVAASVLRKREGELTKLSAQKSSVIKGLANKGEVPVPKATAAIDAQVALLKQQKLPELDGVISRLEGFKNSLQGQTLDVIERNRAALGKAFTDPSLAAVRDAGEKALSAIYAPLREDMAGFIKDKAGAAAHAAWKSANDGLSALAGDLKDSALKRVLSKGDATPESVRRMLFSQQPSDVRRLYKSLTPEGQASARTAVIQEAVAKAGGDIASLNPEKFKAALHKLGTQVGVFFKGDDFVAVDGLMRALKLTEHAAKAGVSPPTGVQNLLPILGIGGGAVLGAGPAIGAGAGIGMLARLYESTGVRNSLKMLAKANAGSAAEKTALARLSKAIGPLTPAIGTAANSAQEPDYHALYGRY